MESQVYVNVYFVQDIDGETWRTEEYCQAVRSTQSKMNVMYGNQSAFTKETDWCIEQNDRLRGHRGHYEVRVENTPAQDYWRSKGMKTAPSITITEEMIDITKPDHGVEVMIKNDGSVMWVNVDGVCRLRICRMPHLVVYDLRKG
jgi:hypothetical protein